MILLCKEIIALYECHSHLVDLLIWVLGLVVRCLDSPSDPNTLNLAYVEGPVMLLRHGGCHAYHLATTLFLMRGSLRAPMDRGK